VAGAAVILAVLLLTVGGTLAAFFGGGRAELYAAGLMALYGLAGLAVAAGIVAALVQRRREILGGEEDEAKKY